MPIFGDTEKEFIRQKLMQEGERLFASFGIKKYPLMKSFRLSALLRDHFIRYILVKNIFIWILPQTFRQGCGVKWKNFWRKIVLYTQGNYASNVTCGCLTSYSVIIYSD